MGGIPNVPAFRDVLCDLELWHEAPAELEKSLFEHFFELIADSGNFNDNIMDNFNDIINFVDVGK